ncbi:glucose 1-dehydrogenase [Nocardia sp. CA2R105]|uniref:SDR family NAD(P)-dependent oxidoreductase n=1 Tax=Nocardia coffeae TaxID=2873381 RepID=UPI001CA785FA|nr:glucose 1-dehydrogenase [Nocardia coffeae]MBY8856856.1 glucose 1-dehydrogenase [Nocardia coffeae]
MRLEGRVALITGGAQGQGAAEAAAFIDEGARVVIADVSVDQGRSTAADLGPQAEFAELDVTNEDAWDTVVSRIAKQYGRLDILVNNAALYRVCPLLEETVAQLDRLLAVNLRGPFLGIRAVAPQMAAGGGGAIVNVSSTAGLLGYPSHTSYGLTKWALRGLTRIAAAELADKGIRVNCLIPGAIEGPMLTSAVRDEEFAQPEAWSGTPLARAGRPTEVAAAAVFLASPDSSYMTGADLVVDGGATATG